MSHLICERTAIYMQTITESGVYSVMFSSKKRQRDNSTMYVQYEVLPSSPKYGRDMTNAMAMFQWRVWADKQEETIVRVNSRVGKNAVHYGVVIYKQKTFAIGRTNSGFGENQLSHYTTLTSYRNRQRTCVRFFLFKAVHYNQLFTPNLPTST